MKNHRFPVFKIVTGGQTGVDRAAFDFALKNGIEIGGWVPKGRIAEDGAIENCYLNLVETRTSDYSERTKLNVGDSDATLIVARAGLTGGTKLTREFVTALGKPFHCVDLKSKDVSLAVSIAQDWLKSIDCEILNIAGLRASEDSEIYKKASVFFSELFNNFYPAA